MTTRTIAILLMPLCCACDSKDGLEGDAGPDVDTVRGCVTAADCAVGVDYTSLDRCGEPEAYRASHIEDRECLTALGEEPPASCAECIDDIDAERRGRLPEGYEWVLECVDGTCSATDAICSGDCSPADACTTPLQCPIGWTCHEGACTEGCDTGMDCRVHQVCVREPPDLPLGRCVGT